MIRIKLHTRLASGVLVTTVTFLGAILLAGQIGIIALSGAQRATFLVLAVAGLVPALSKVLDVTVVGRRVQLDLRSQVVVPGLLSGLIAAQLACLVPSVFAGSGPEGTPALIEPRPVASLLPPHAKPGHVKPGHRVDAYRPKVWASPSESASESLSPSVAPLVRDSRKNNDTIPPAGDQDTPSATPAGGTPSWSYVVRPGARRVSILPDRGVVHADDGDFQLAVDAIAPIGTATIAIREDGRTCPAGDESSAGVVFSARSSVVSFCATTRDGLHVEMTEGPDPATPGGAGRLLMVQPQ